MAVKHAKVSAVADGADPALVRPSDWNANHVIDSGTITKAMMADIGTDRLLGRDTAGAGVPEELVVSDGLEFSGAGGVRARPAGQFAPLRSNNDTWYQAGGLGISFGIGTVVVAVGTLIAIPFPVSRRKDFDRIAFRVTTGGGAGSVARAGIYADDGSVYPGALVADGGEHVTTSTGVKSSTIAVTLDGGALYWLVYLCGTAAPTIATNQRTLILLGFDSGLANYNVWRTVAQAYGALPANYPGGATYATSAGNSNVPIIAMRGA